MESERRAKRWKRGDREDSAAAMQVRDRSTRGEERCAWAKNTGGTSRPPSSACAAVRAGGDLTIVPRLYTESLRSEPRERWLVCQGRGQPTQPHLFSVYKPLQRRPPHDGRAKPSCFRAGHIMGSWPLCFSQCIRAIYDWEDRGQNTPNSCHCLNPSHLSSTIDYTP
jgi:hypothetical protein